MKVLLRAKQLRRFADGGEVDSDVEASNASDDPIRELNRRKGWTADEEDAPRARSLTPKGGSESADSTAESPEPAKKQSFSEAFSAAKDGSTFSWNGKQFKKEYAKPAAKATAPTEGPARGMNRAPAASNTRADASRAMADRASLDAQQRRAASEARAQEAREAKDEIKRESRSVRDTSGESKSGFGSKITNVPKPGARSIYADLDPAKIAAGAATIASAVPAIRAVRMGTEIVKGARAAAAAREASKQISRDADRVPLKNGGLVQRQTVKSHGKAC